MLGEGSYTFTELPASVQVGNYSSIAKNCSFHENGDNHYCIYNRRAVFTTNWLQLDPGKDIEVGNDVWIGEGVRILPGIHVGDGAIIGAGAVISKDVPAYAVVVGNPQILKRFRFSEDQIDKLLKIKWWDWPKEKVQSHIEFMKDIDKFLEVCGHGT